MKIFYKIKINNYTYLFFLLCLLCGFIKNISIIFFICLFHELGHIYFIKLFKYEIEKVEILPFGGFTKANKLLNSSINKDIIINLGGVLFQVLLIIIIYLLKNNFNIITYNIFINYNIILIMFNLLPIIPLDGNNIMHLLLEKLFSYHLSYKINFYISLISLILFLIYNILYNVNNYFIFTFLIYQSIIYIKNYKYLKKRFLLERYLYDIEYKKINNNTKDIKDLKKEVLHFFKSNNKYLNEKNKIENELYKSR